MRRAALPLLAIALAAVTVASACSLLVDTSGLSGGPTDDGGSFDGGAEAGASDAGNDTGTGTDAGGDGGPNPPSGCLGDAGPTMIDVGTYCIDSTEVTNAQYTAFLAAKSGDTSGQSAACAWNTTFALKCSESATDGLAPVTCVNWCDAYAYCAWAGKRLCGKIGGGPSTLADVANAATDQWYRACSAAGTLPYPYGSAYVAGRCNDMTYAAGKPIAVGSLSACVGGYPGLFDMEGNAVEWVDLCTANAGETDPCYIRSSAFDDGDSVCTDNSPQDRNSFDATKGFRCCSR